MSLRAPALDDPQAIRQADAELLSLALMDARNLTLRWLDVFEARDALAARLPGAPATRASALHAAAHAGWYQERWIARHVQRARGERANPDAPPLASIEPRADGWFEPDAAPPDAATLRDYLARTLDTTLDLLAAAGTDDDALHVFRAALLHEDRLDEALAEAAAALQFGEEPQPPPPVSLRATPLPARAPRPPLWLPPTRLALGSARGGFVPDNERWVEELAVPEFEIDAQAVTWARYVEFAEDGGYDREELWSAAGWRWLAESGRRAPRDVAQLRGGVLAERGGALQRVPLEQAVVHATRHEAEAWCRWAGRRLPTEPEWEAAVVGARHRGFAWGDVFEWVAGSARGWRDHAATPGGLDPLPAPGTQGVLRGASVFTPPRQRHRKARRFLPPEADHALSGFRSVAL